jgi:hypothetical protein
MLPELVSVLIYYSYHEGVLTVIVHSEEQPLGLAIAPAHLWPQLQVLQLLRRFGSQGRRLCTCQGMGFGTRSPCLGILLQEHLLFHTLRHS